MGVDHLHLKAVFHWGIKVTFAAFPSVMHLEMIQKGSVSAERCV